MPPERFFFLPANAKKHYSVEMSAADLFHTQNALLALALLFAYLVDDIQAAFFLGFSNILSQKESLRPSFMAVV